MSKSDSAVDYAATGLSAAQVRARAAAGKRNVLPPRGGKSFWNIVRTNVFTRINAILGVLFLMVISTGSWINSAFGLLIIVNSVIGAVQEFRARRTLASLSIIGAEQPLVVRDGECRPCAQEDLVIDDVIVLQPGSQVVVDGQVLSADYLAMDESLLTGESAEVEKKAGDAIYSGSFVAAGTGRYRVQKVGADSYAARLTAQAAKFSLDKSQLQAGIDSILKYITWILIPVGIFTVISQAGFLGNNWRALVLAITGALVPMVPEGLVLITSTAFALGIIRLGKRKCLVQELPAIEGLARVDIVCADKTGTLTAAELEFAEMKIIEAEPAEKLKSEIAQLVWADPAPNSTIKALQEVFPCPAELWEVHGRKVFNSRDKWSGVVFSEVIGGESNSEVQSPLPATSTIATGHRTFLLGAPDILDAAGTYRSYWEPAAAQGLRVLLLGESSADLEKENSAGSALPPLRARAVLILRQKIRPDAAATLDFFREQGVEIKVISGDNAVSVAAVARRLGMGEVAAVDTRELAPDELAAKVEQNQIFGRVRPAQKQEMVRALQKAGHTVAMTGDGVNDVLALKDADISIAMGNGSSAARTVAKIVLLDNRFATLPYVVAEGRRVIGNIERVAKLFLTKTVYSALLAMLVIFAGVPFPFQPIHVTITGWFTIGIPAFILALPVNNQRARPGFTRRVLAFSFPAGVAVASAAFFTYIGVRAQQSVMTPQLLTQASTAALAALIISATWVLVQVARPWQLWKVLLILLPLIFYSIIFTWSFTQQIFHLDSTNLSFMLYGLAGGVGGIVLLELLCGVKKIWNKRLKNQQKVSVP